MVSATEKMIFQISCILFINYILYCILYYRNDLISKLHNLSLNLNNQIWLLTTILDIAAPDWDFLEGKKPRLSYSVVESLVPRMVPK